MSTDAPVFDVERFERVAAGGANVLLRVAGRWRSHSPARLSLPVLLLDDGRHVKRIATLRGPDDVAPVAGPDPPQWRAAFAVPAALLTDANLAFALETNVAIIDLPPPDEAAPRSGRGERSAATRTIDPEVSREEARRRVDAERAAEERRQAMAVLEQRLAAERARRAAAERAAGDARDELARLRAQAEAELHGAAAEGRELSARVELHDRARAAAEEQARHAHEQIAAARAELDARIAAEREARAQTEQALRETQSVRSQAQALESARASAEAQAAARAQALAAARAELAQAHEATRVAMARDAQSARALEVASAVERERDQAVVGARAAADRAERAKGQVAALERELDEVRSRADTGAIAQRQVRDLAARVAELEKVRRALAEVADRVPELEGALEDAHVRRAEIEERAGRVRAEVVQLREEHTRALEEAARLEQARADSERLEARVAELEQVVEQRERAAKDAVERAQGRVRALEREREEMRSRAEVADRVPVLEEALEVAQARRAEVEKLAQRTGAEVGELRAAHAEAVERAALVEEAQAEAQRLAARIEELEEVAQRRERAIADEADAVAAERDEAQAQLAQAAQRLGAERDRSAASSQAAERRAAELQALAQGSARHAEALEADLAQARSRIAFLEERRTREVEQLRAAQTEIERLARGQASAEALAVRLEQETAVRAGAEQRAESVAREAARLAALVRAATDRASGAEEEAAELRRQQQRAVEALREVDAERDRRETAEGALERITDARASLAARVAELEQSNAALADRATEAELEAEFALVREREHATTLDVLERWPVLVLLLVALPLGLLAGLQPAMAAALLSLAIVTALVVAAPVVHFALLIAVTAIVPYDWQQAVEFGAGGAGLQLADLLLITGLARAGVVLVRRPPRGLTAVVSGLMLVFMALVLAQGIHGWLAGHDVSQVSYETRQVLTWGTLLIAIPLLMDPRRRSQLLAATMVVGLLVGLWGIAQWVLDIPFGEAGDAGVQAGVALTSAGRGQVQGALFAFPVAVLMSLAVLVSGGPRSPRARALLGAILVTNALSLLLTFERSLWVGTVAGALFIMLRSSAVSRLRAIITTALVVLLAMPVLATIAPGALTTARERLLSIGQYGSDNSVRFRIDESRFVFDRIADRPVLGSGMGATIHWGRPYDRVAATSTPFAHNSVLWLSWKLGIPAVILLLAMIGCAFVPRRYGESTTNRAVRHGAQAALVSTLIVSVTFQSLASRPITPTLGLVLALCVCGAAGGALRPRAQTQRAEPLAYAT